MQTFFLPQSVPAKNFETSAHIKCKLTFWLLRDKTNCRLTELVVNCSRKMKEKDSASHESLMLTFYFLSNFNTGTPNAINTPKP